MGQCGQLPQAVYTLNSIALGTNDAQDGAGTPSALEWYVLSRRYFMPEDHARGLATGGNASPLLFNIYMKPFDEMMSAYADAYGMTYTRYMDDIVLSAPDTGDPNFDRIGRGKARAVKEGLEQLGMKLNDHKIRYKDFADGEPMIVLGVQMGEGGEWQIPHVVVQRLREFFNNSLDDLPQLKALPNDHDYAERVGQIYGLHGHIDHFVSRRRARGEELHPSETMLLNRYEACRNMIHSLGVPKQSHGWVRQKAAEVLELEALDAAE